MQLFDIIQLYLNDALIAKVYLLCSSDLLI